MPDQRIMRWVASKYDGLAQELTERARRRWAAVEALSLGRGGVTAVSAATGLAQTTIRRGIAELAAGNPPPADRERRPGAGRKGATAVDPGLRDALDRLVEPDSRGDPESPLRWTCRSTRQLARELTAGGHPVGPTTVRHLLKEAGYSLQATVRPGRGNPTPTGTPSSDTSAAG